MSAAVRSEDVAFPRAGDEIRGYFALPAETTARPGLVLIPDVRGLYEHYRDVARRFAGDGFATLALDLYSREGPPELPDLETVRRWIASLPDPRVLADIAAAVDYVAGRSEVDSRAIGITGYCMGGQYALMAACSVPRLTACVSWYGMLRYREKNERKPESPLDMASRLGCPYLGLFGEEDALIPLADVEELAATLEQSGKDFTIVTYPGAGHAFFNDSRPDAYRPHVAREAWGTAIGFLRDKLGARH